MTAIDAPPPPPPAPTYVPPYLAQPLPAAPSKSPISVLSVIAFAIIVLTSIGYMTAKTLVPVFDAQNFEKQVDTIAVVFGVFGLLSILPIAAGVVLGHLGVRRSPVARRGRALGVAALSMGYLLLALYFNRIIVSVIALISFPHNSSFLENNFFWA